MKTRINTILTIFVALLLMQCEFLEDFEKGNGNYVTERRAVEAFDEIRVGGNFEVILEKGAQPVVQINADENLLDFIDTEVNSGILDISQEKKLFSKRKIRLVIHYQELEDIRAMGATLIKNEGYLDAENLEIRMEGAGVIDLHIRSEDLKVVLSGAGMVTLSGEVNTQELRLTGAGKLEAFDLESRVCDISVGGLGGAEVYVTEKLNAKIEGIGGIEYAGNPEELVSEINGLGKIQPSDKE